MNRLSDRQDQCLTFIREHARTNGYPPTLREIGLYMGIRSTNGVNDHLNALQRKGYIGRRDMKARGIVLVDMPLPDDVTCESQALMVIASIVGLTPGSKPIEIINAVRELTRQSDAAWAKEAS